MLIATFSCSLAGMASVAYGCTIIMDTDGRLGYIKGATLDTRIAGGIASMVTITAAGLFDSDSGSIKTKNADAVPDLGAAEVYFSPPKLAFHPATMINDFVATLILENPSLPTPSSKKGVSSPGGHGPILLQPGASNTFILDLTVQYNNTDILAVGDYYFTVDVTCVIKQ